MRSAVSLVALVLVGCSRAEPPQPDLGGASPSVAPLPGNAAPLVIPSATAPATTATPNDSGPVSASPSASAAAAEDSSALPQTRDKPKAEGAAFDARVTALWNAIQKDDPDLALPFFFPVKAYQQVKGIPRPESDWKHRLVAAYARDIHALHKRLGESPESAKLVRMEVPEAGGRWVEVDEETNKIGYFRVYGSHLRFEADGKERSFEVKSLISWRGEWFVVHLSGFK